MQPDREGDDHGDHDGQGGAEDERPGPPRSSSGPGSPAGPERSEAERGRGGRRAAAPGWRRRRRRTGSGAARAPRPRPGRGPPARRRRRPPAGPPGPASRKRCACTIGHRCAGSRVIVAASAGASQPAASQARRLLVHDPVERAEQVVADLVGRPALQRVEEGGPPRPDVAWRASPAGPRPPRGRGTPASRSPARSGSGPGRPTCGRCRSRRASPARRARPGCWRASRRGARSRRRARRRARSPPAHRIGAASSGVSRPRWRISSARSVPSTYSITSHCWLCPSPTSSTRSKTATTLAWLSLAASFASRSARRASGVIPPGATPIFFSATMRCEDLVAAAPDGAHAAAADLRLERVPARDHRAYQAAALLLLHSTSTHWNRFAVTVADGRGL